jgi:hypothetical protein
MEEGNRHNFQEPHLTHRPRKITTRGVARRAATATAMGGRMFLARVRSLSQASQHGVSCRRGWGGGGGGRGAVGHGREREALMSTWRFGWLVGGMFA